MSTSEVKHRAIEQAKRSISAYGVHPSNREIRQGSELPTLPGISERISHLADEQSLLENWTKLAERAMEGRLRLLGIEWPGNSNSNRWFQDPVTKKYWPSKPYCFRILYRHNNHLGDIKYVWELNRLQYLQPIAALAHIKNDKNLATFCVHEIESWIDENPAFHGINWISGIELALRSVSIIIVISLLGKQSFSNAQTEKILNSLLLHGYWLMRFPSRFSSANNHLIAEAAGLFILGTLMPGYENSEIWADYGRNTLISEAFKQILDDGVGVEQSPTYTAFTVEWLLLCGMIGNLSGQPFPDTFWQRLESAGDFFQWITDSSGNQPRIGDDDEGTVFFSNSSPDQYVTCMLGSIGTVIKTKHIFAPVILPHLRDAFFGRPNPILDLPNGLKSFHHGGYTVSRTYKEGVETLLVFDHGPLGYLSIAAHGHADVLSVWLHINGRPVLVDAGTFLYHSGGAWRNHMRGTTAHNTLTLNGHDSSKITGAFNWSHKAKASVISYKSDMNAWSIEAEHDGYAREFGAIHKRKIERQADDTIAITDQLCGNESELPVEIGFLVHPDLSIRQEDASWIIHDQGSPLLQVGFQENNLLRGHIQHGQEPILRGWYSPAFGRRVATSRLTLDGLLPPSTNSRIILKTIFKN